MRYEENPKPQLTVSRRNLLTLLAKLDANRAANAQVSRCTLGDPDGIIWLVAEEDEVHYDPAARAAIGHAPYPGRVVRDAVSQAPVQFHAVDPKQGGDLMNPDGAW